MLYELRRYRLLPGTGPLMHERIRTKVVPLFTELGIAPPIGVWDVTSGADLPVFAWLLGWESFEARQKSWAAFGQHWPKRRGEGMKPGEDEFVLTTSLSLLSAWPETPPDLPKAGAGKPVHELWVRRVAVSQAPAAKDLFLGAEAKLLTGKGAAVLAGFDFVAEPDLPQHAMLLAWPDAATREAALRAYDDSAAIGEALRTTRNVSGRPVVTATDRFVLRPAEYLAG